VSITDPLLSIVIPVYNEVNSVLELIRLVQKEPHRKEIIIVDDCSSDGTREHLQKLDAPNIRLFLNERNQGKGFCLQKGFAEARGDIVIIQDADLEYYPDEYGALIQKIVEGKADVVYGSRFLGAHRAFLYWHFLGNTVINLIANVALNTCLTDLMTCYKALRRPVLQSLTLKANRFGIEPEITAEVFKRGYRVYEVPISYNGRGLDEGKKIKWTDFFSCVYWLLRSMLRGVDVGQDTLLKIRLMKRNNRWTYTMLKPFLGAAILELGAGMGTFSRMLIGRGRRVTLLEANPEYARMLGEQFVGNPDVTILHADAIVVDSAVGTTRFDTVVANNLLEHISDDVNLVQRVARILLPGGRLILVVPAHPRLFGAFDKAAGHYRRYRRADLRKLVESQGFAVETMCYMNALSAIGWFVQFGLLRGKRMPGSSARLVDRFIPAIAAVERAVKPPFGLWLFCVARRAGSA
jgi:glycosyltransferase involved in cell wall biosynthesis